MEVISAILKLFFINIYKIDWNIVSNLKTSHNCTFTVEAARNGGIESQLLILILVEVINDLTGESYTVSSTRFRSSHIDSVTIQKIESTRMHRDC